MWAGWFKRQGYGLDGLDSILGSRGLEIFLFSFVSRVDLRPIANSGAFLAIGWSRVGLASLTRLSAVAVKHVDPSIHILCRPSLPVMGITFYSYFHQGTTTPKHDIW